MRLDKYTTAAVPSIYLHTRMQRRSQHGDGEQRLLRRRVLRRRRLLRFVAHQEGGGRVPEPCCRPDRAAVYGNG